jgi:hypothetical protein
MRIIGFRSVFMVVPLAFTYYIQAFGSDFHHAIVIGSHPFVLFQPGNGQFDYVFYNCCFVISPLIETDPITAVNSIYFSRQ